MIEETEYDVELQAVGNHEITAEGRTQQQAISRAVDELSLDDLSVTVVSVSEKTRQ